MIYHMTASMPGRWRDESPYVGIIDGKVAVLQRETDTLTPNGNKMGGRWVLRIDHKMVDFDQYRNDIADRYRLELHQHPETE